MRLLFLLLVLANVVFYAYAFVARQQGSAGSQISLLQINPEKIRIIKATGVAASEKPQSAAQAKAPPGLAACLEWGPFAGPDAARAAAAITRLELPQPLMQRVVADVGGYWVYIPPLKTRAEVDRKIGELKALGVTDFFAVQDQTQWRNAISLGIFKSEEAAKNFLAGLREKGVRSAIVERRENFLKQIAYFVREPGEAMVARLVELQREFPGSEIKAVACPPDGA
ncbi:MAG: SPOR domain-containing protein [Burkholderiales bacterium]|nr:SPOR domain-containing protein [Burkholderiales bacterium]